MPQIHLRAEPGDYAPLVLLPGDPNRATKIASRFDGGLEAARLVNEHHLLYGYTGSYGGRGARVAGVAFRDVAELDRGAATDVAGPGRGDGHDGNPKGDARPLSRPRRLVSIRPSLHTRPDEGEPRPPSPWIVGSPAAPSFVTFTTVAR